jgi:hypothetical protein
MSLERTHENEVFDSEGNAVGYHTWFGGLYVCYTCGHLCECGDDITEDDLMPDMFVNARECVHGHIDDGLDMERACMACEFGDI